MYKFLGSIAHLIGAYFVVKTFYELGSGDKFLALIYATIGFLFEMIKNHVASDLFANRTKGILKNIFSCVIVLVLVSLSLVCTIGTLGKASQAGDIANNKAIANKASISNIDKSMEDLRLVIALNHSQIESLQNRIGAKELSKPALSSSKKNKDKDETLATIDKIDSSIANLSWSLTLQRNELKANISKLEQLELKKEELLPATMVANSDLFDSLASSFNVSRDDAKRLVKLLIAIMLEFSSIYLLTLAKLEETIKQPTKLAKEAKYAWYRKYLKLIKYASLSDWLKNSKLARKLTRILR